MLADAKKHLARLYRKFVAPFKSNLGNPQYFAVSMAVGTFCALVPTVGQGYICFLIWLVFKRVKKLNFSLIVSCAVTLFTNPLTMPFFLYVYYAVGRLCTMRAVEPFGAFIAEAKDILDTGRTFGNMIRQTFVFLADSVGEPIAIGCAICMAVLTPAAYFCSYAFAEYRLEKIRRRNFFKHKERCEKNLI